MNFRAELAIEEIHADDQRVFVATRQVDQRAVEVAPGALEGENCHSQQSGQRERNKDPSPDLQTICAINIGGIFQFDGELQKKLAQQEDVDRAAPEPGGDDQRVEGVEPAEIKKEHIERNQRHLRRQHDRRDGGDEPKIAARKTDAGKPIRAERRSEQCAEQHHRRDVDRVPQPTAEEHPFVGPGVVEIFQVQIARQNGRGEIKGFLRAFDRSQDHPQQWQHKNKPHEAQDRIDQEGLQKVTAHSLRAGLNRGTLGSC